MPACRDADYISENALGISVNGGDMPTQQFLTLPSSSNENLSTSTVTSEADSFCKALPCFSLRSFVKAEHCHHLARSGSPEQTVVEVWDTQSNAS